MHFAESPSVLASDSGVWLAIAGPALGLILVLTPIAVARGRRVVNIWPTVVVSVLISWTCIGFFIALIVAVSSRTHGMVAAQGAAVAAAIAQQQPSPAPPARRACDHEFYPRKESGRIVQRCALCNSVGRPT